MAPRNLENLQASVCGSELHVHVHSNGQQVLGQVLVCVCEWPIVEGNHWGLQWHI